MGLRDILVIFLIGAGTIAALGRPWIGAITWNWIAFMNPHRLAWNIGNWPVAEGVALTTLFGLFLTHERRALPLRAETVLMVLLAAYFCFTTAFAWDPAGSLSQLESVLKVYLFIFVILMLFYEPARIRWLMLVTVGSIGFFGFKGGIFAILTGGQYKVLGPSHSFIADNTSLGLAMAMVLPMAFFAAKAEETRWVRIALYAVFVLSIPAIMFTYSRGAVLGLLAVLFVVAWRYSKGWLVLGVLAATAFLYFGLDYLPEKWVDRQQTTVEYHQDDSAMQRIQAWGVAFNVALDRPLLGAGFNLAGAGTGRWLNYANFLGDWENVPRAAHSIWFEVLGEHGFVALFMFIALLVVTWWRLGRTAEKARKADVSWIYYYAYGMQLALVPYVVCGTFLSLAYFDLYYTCVAFSVILERALLDTQLSSDESSVGATLEPSRQSATVSLPPYSSLNRSGTRGITVRRIPSRRRET